MSSIKKIKLYIKQRSFIGNDEWEFVLKFPAELDDSRTMVLTINEEGECISLISVPNNKSDRAQSINYTPALDIFKKDVEQLYSFDIDDICEYLKDNYKEIIFYSYEDDISYEYSGKSGIFRDILLKMQDKHKEKQEDTGKKFMHEFNAFFAE